MLTVRRQNGSVLKTVTFEVKEISRAALPQEPNSKNVKGQTFLEESVECNNAQNPFILVASQLRIVFLKKTEQGDTKTHLTPFFKQLF